MSDLETCCLSDLKNGLPGITEAWGSLFCEASALCLEKQNHKNGSSILIHGNNNNYEIILKWDENITEQKKRAWADIQELTEFGAVGISIILVLKTTDYTVIERSAKGTGFDYWLGNNDDPIPFIRQARLEVSGIMVGDEPDIKERVNQKLKQTSRSDSLGLPAIIAVIEFSKPLAYLENK